MAAGKQTPKPLSEWALLPHKFLNTAFGVLFSVYVGFQIWLGFSVSDLKRTSAETATAVKSLVEARKVGAEQRTVINTERLNALEDKARR
jgi:hypothetical protein